MKKLLTTGWPIIILSACSDGTASDTPRNASNFPLSQSATTFEIPHQIETNPSVKKDASNVPTLDKPSQLASDKTDVASSVSRETLTAQVKALHSDLLAFLSLDYEGKGDDRSLRDLLPTTEKLFSSIETPLANIREIEAEFVKTQAKFFEAVSVLRQSLEPNEKMPRAHVIPIFWNRLSALSAPSEATIRTKSIAANAARYLIGPSYAGTYRTYASDGYLNLGGSIEANIRYPAMTALTFAISLKTGFYDPKDLSTDNATKRALNLIRTISAKHNSNTTADKSRWGSNWQTALWAYYNGFAAWLLWDLGPQDQDHTVKMIVAEANRFLTGNDVYLIGRSGEKLFATELGKSEENVKDTKTEENQWSAALLGLAVAMMPDHPNAEQWGKRQRELLVAAVARKADLSSDEIVNGIQVKTWLRGTNITDKGTLYNHNLLHPIYMLVDQGLYEPVVAGLARQCAPVAAKRHVPLIYRALVDEKHKPNGNAFGLPKEVISSGSEFTIYQPNSAQIFYPEGNDWGLQFAGYFGAFDQLISVNKLDTAVSTSAATWEALHSEEQLKLQNRSQNGSTYIGSQENTYGGREQRIGVIYSLTYLATRLIQSDAGDLTCWTND